MKEKRHYKRIHFVDEIEISHAGKTYHGMVMDISLKGVLIKLKELPAGDVAGLNWQIRLPLSPEVEILVNAKPSHVEQHSVGFQFTEIDSDSMMHLRRMLELNTGEASEIERELEQMVDDLRAEHSH